MRQGSVLNHWRGEIKIVGLMGRSSGLQIGRGAAVYCS